MLHRLFSLLAGLFLLAAAAAATIPAPPPPEMYDVRIRYQIVAFRNEHVRQYQQMQRYLAAHGFRRDPEEDVQPEEAEDFLHPLPMRGTVPGARARELLGAPNVETIVLIPAGEKMPEDPKERVRVEMQLAILRTPERQKLLHQQTREVLAKLNFRSGVGYDHRGYTRLVGSIPASEVDTMTRDLRSMSVGQGQPPPFGSTVKLTPRAVAALADVGVPERVLDRLGDLAGKRFETRAAFAAALAEELKADHFKFDERELYTKAELEKFKKLAFDLASAEGVWPVRLTEFRPKLPVPPPAPGLPVVPRGEEKLTQELRSLLADKEQADKPRRLEFILAKAPTDIDRSWRRRLADALPDVVFEGRVGSVLTVVAAPAKARALAALDDVLAVRLPAVARPGSQPPGSNAETWKPLFASSGLARLHDLNCRGRGTRVAIIDSDFSGWEALRGKSLPATTVFLDLTAERNPDLLPDPPATEGPGPGTRRAVTLMRAAPEADLTLIRIDAAAPYMLYQVARAINGDDSHSLNLENRFADIQHERKILATRQDELLEERKLVMENFDEEGPGAKRRAEYKRHQADFDRDQKQLMTRVQRYLAHIKALEQLRGIRVVASGLVWDEGFPVDGTSTLTRYFDDRPFRAALWFQAAGDVRGQSWAGPFRDADGNGIMEFSPPNSPLPAGVWTPELSFLAWKHDGTSASLPAGARLRVSLQWREAHDGRYLQVGEDLYREPLARKMRLLVLRQVDPEGKNQPADDMEVVAQSSGLPQRLSQTASGATYEIAVDFVVRTAGRYAVQVEGQAPVSVFPRSEPTIPAIRRDAEMQVRLFVTTAEGAGRAVWRDHVTDAGSLGVPSDARAAITIGAADDRGRRQAYSAGGAPFAAELLVKPDLLAYDAGGGTAEAAAFAAGVAAAARSGAPSRTATIPALGEPGGLLQLPEGWPRPAR
jgi:hypothetical protein